MFVQRVRSLRHCLNASHRFSCLLVLSFLSSFASLADMQLNAQDAPSAPATKTADETDDEEQERLVVERFLELLLKRPRPGTAFDKVYSYHIQRGSLDKFCDELQREATNRSHGESWFLLGLVELQRRRESEAIVALQKAEVLLPQDAMASYHYAKSLALIGSADQAVDALNRAIQRKPAKADLLLVLQDLGRLYQRMGKGKKATEVWKNLEESFPGDARIKEQIASVLAEEGATADALARYQELATTTKDRFRKIELSVFAANLKETLGRREDALSDYEQLLGQINPESWMYQDLRNRIDRTFMSRNDYDGLAKYYERWADAHPDDIDAMLRIGRLLQVQRRTPEAKEWFSKAIKLAPKNPLPRLSLVDALEREREFAAAAEAMRSLVELEPDNVDHIVRWGSLIFTNDAIPEPDRARSAADVWNKLLEKRKEDPLTVARVAGLLRNVGLVDEAIDAYRRAIALADSESQYREYLGEYLFGLNRKEEALAVWKEIATGPRENRDNQVRLSEVLASFHLDDQALETMARACADNPTYDLRFRFAKMLSRAKRYDEALKELDFADSQTESVEEQSAVIDQQIEIYQANGQLQSKIAAFQTSVAGADKDKPASWQKLALFLEADRRFQQSATAIAHAIELQPQSTVLLTIQARVLEKAGMHIEAIDALGKLASFDRRHRSDHLMQIAAIQLRIGQFKAAVATGQELISGSAANAEELKFFADLCFQTGEEALGLEALRRNLRRNPNDLDAIRSLASRLGLMGEDNEAIELYWRAYSTSTSIDDKREDVLALTPLYKRKDQIEQLINRLTNLGQELGDQRAATLLVSTVKQVTGDLIGARSLLDSLITDDSRDIDLLNTLIQLAASESDWAAAVRYQRQLNRSAPSPEGDLRLAKFLFEKGEIDEPLALWTSQIRGLSSADRISQVVDLLIKHNQREKAHEYALQALERERDNWEALTAIMCAMLRSKNRQLAMEVADRLLEIKLPFDTPSSQFKKSAAALSGASGANPQQVDLSSRSEWLDRFAENYQLLSYQVGQGTAQSSPIISSYGDAKLIALILKQEGETVTRGLDGNVLMNSATYKRNPSKLIESAADLPADDIWDLVATNFCIDRFSSTSSDVLAQDWLLNRLVELGDAEAPGLLLESWYYDRLASKGARLNSFTTISRSWRSWLYNNSALSQPAATNSASGRANAKPKPLQDLALDRMNRLFELSVAKTGSTNEQIAYLLWFAEEYRLAEREISVLQFVMRAKELAEQTNATDQLVAFLPFDREFALKRFAESFNKQSQAQSNRPNGLNTKTTNPYTPYSVTMFLGELLSDKPDPNEIAALCSAIKEAQIATARTVPESQLSVYDPTKKLALLTYGMNSGRATFSRVSLQLPSDSALQSADLLTAFYFIRQKGNATVREAITTRLAEEAESPDQDPLTNAVDRLCYATWLWWENRKDDAIHQMSEFRKLGIANDVGVLIETGMLIGVNKIDEAIDLLDSLNPTSPRLLEYSELTLMSLALLNGNTDRAKKAVERLYSMPLNSATQLRVSEAMDQLGMNEMSSAIVQRLRRGGVNDLPTMFELMTKLKKSEVQADKDAALELAWKIYQRTHPKTSPQGRQTSGQSRGPEIRTATVRLLVEFGEANKLIRSLEGRVAQSPMNEPLVHQLAELYQETGNGGQAAQLLKPFLQASIRSGAAPLTADEIIQREANSRILLLNETLSKGGDDWTDRLKKELLQVLHDSRLAAVNAKIASGILGTDVPDRRSAKGKLQECLSLVAESSEKKESLKVFLKQFEAIEKTELTIPQLVVLVCIADAADDKTAALSISKSIAAHPSAAYSQAALLKPGRETAWAAARVAAKLGDADLAVKLARLTLKPTSSEDVEAMRFALDLALLQFELGKIPDAEVTLREILARLKRPMDKEFLAKCNLAMEIAMLAADHSLTDVSFEAALSASALTSTASEKMNDNFLKLVQRWQEKKTPANRTYETLKALVFRNGDPNRWRLYPVARRNYGGSHDFTFPEVDAKPLALVLVDFAQANDSLSMLLQDIDRLSKQPSLDVAMRAMKVYTHRVQGHASEAAKLFDETIEAQKAVSEEILLLNAFTMPVPGGDASSIVPHETLGPLLKKFLKDRIMHTGTRMAVLSQMKVCIASDDHLMLEKFVSAVEESIPKVTNYDQQSLKLMLTQFYKYLAGECTVQGKDELAEVYLKRASAE